MTNRPLDLRTATNFLWRRRIVILITGLIGLCGGIIYGLSVRSQPQANALVYVSPQAGAASPDDTLRTQTVIATSSPVVTPALRSISPPVSPTDVTVTAAAISNTNILHISVRAPTSLQAVQSANAVADAYINYARQNGLVTSPPLLIQPASIAATPSVVRQLSTAIPLGAVAGILIGVAAVLLRSRRDPRLRRRDDIADALGLPVLATIETGVYKTVSDWTRFLDEFQPSPASLWNLRRVLRSHTPDSYTYGSIMRVVSFADDLPAHAVGPQLALAAAELGLTTTIVPCMHDAMSPLRAACARLARHNLIPEQAADSVPDSRGPASRDAFGDSAPEGIDLVISLSLVDRASPTWAPPVGRTVLAISAGAATSDELASLALVASEGGARLEGAVLVNPEPGDLGTGGSRTRSAHVRPEFSLRRSQGVTATVSQPS